MARFKFDEIAINSTEKKKPVEEDKYTYLGLEHLDSGTLKVSRFGADVAPIGEKLTMRKGDVLFGKRRAYQKKVAIAPFDGIFSAHGMVLRPRTDVISSKLFPFFVSSNHFLDEAIKISVGSLSPTINWRDLKDLEFNIPPIEKQDVLADELWAMEETKEAYNQLLIATDALVKSQFIELFGAVKSECQRYPIVSLDYVCNSITDGSHNPPIGVDHSDNYMLSSKNIINGLITLDDPRYLTDEQFAIEDKRTQVAANDVLLTIVGTIGRTAIVPKYRPKIVLQRSVAVLHPKSEMINSVYLRQALDCIREEIEAEAHGIAQKGIYLGQLKKLEIVLPPFDLQNQFAAFYEQTDKSKFALLQNIEKLEQCRNALMQKSFG